MKKIGKITLSATLIGGLLIQTGCFGGFKLTRKLYDFNNSFGDKFIKELVFLPLSILQVYTVCGFIDIVALNLIEFYTGTNPLAMQEGQIETKTVAAKDKIYEISAMKNKFVIKEVKGPNAGQVAEIVFTPSQKTWALNANGESHILTQELANGRVNVFMPDGTVRNYTKDNTGLAQAHAMLSHQ